MEAILILVVIGAVAGWLASMVIPNGYGLIGTIIVGMKIDFDLLVNLAR